MSVKSFRFFSRLVASIRKRYPLLWRLNLGYAIAIIVTSIFLLPGLVERVVISIYDSSSSINDLQWRLLYIYSFSLGALVFLLYKFWAEAILYRALYGISRTKWAIHFLMYLGVILAALSGPYIAIDKAISSLPDRFPDINQSISDIDTLKYICSGRLADDQKQSLLRLYSSRSQNIDSPQTNQIISLTLEKNASLSQYTVKDPVYYGHDTLYSNRVRDLVALCGEAFSVKNPTPKQLRISVIASNQSSVDALSNTLALISKLRLNSSIYEYTAKRGGPLAPSLVYYVLFLISCIILSIYLLISPENRVSSASRSFLLSRFYDRFTSRRVKYKKGSARIHPIRWALEGNYLVRDLFIFGPAVFTITFAMDTAQVPFIFTDSEGNLHNTIQSLLAPVFILTPFLLLWTVSRVPKEPIKSNEFMSLFYGYFHACIYFVTIFGLSLLAIDWAHQTWNFFLGDGKARVVESFWEFLWFAHEDFYAPLLIVIATISYFMTLRLGYLFRGWSLTISLAIAPVVAFMVIKFALDNTEDSMTFFVITLLITGISFGIVHAIKERVTYLRTIPLGFIYFSSIILYGYFLWFISEQLNVDQFAPNKIVDNGTIVIICTVYIAWTSFFLSIGMSMLKKAIDKPLI